MGILDNTISISFPPQKVPLSKKTKQWKEASVDGIIGRDGAFIKEKERMKTCYDLYNSIFNEKDLMYVTNPFKVDDSFPASLQNFNIIRPKINLLLGEESKRPQNVVVYQSDQEAVSHIQEKMKTMLSEVVMQEILAEAGEPQSEEEEATLDEKIEKVMRYITSEYNSPSETTALSSIKYLRRKLNLDHEFLKGFKDGLIGGKEIHYVGVRNGDPFSERVNVIECAHDNDPDLDNIEDGDWFVRHMKMSPANIYDRFNDVMTEADLDKMMALVEGRGGTAKSDYNRIDFKVVDTSLTERDNLQGVHVDVWHVVWRSFKKVGFLSFEDEDGEISVDLVEEGYEPVEGEQITWDWASEIWEGYRIGDGIYVGIQPLPYQNLSINNPFGAKLPYIGSLYSDTNSVNRSLVDIMKPLAYMYIIVWYRLEVALARDKGKVINMDITQIPKSMGIDFQKWAHYLSSIGVNIINPYEEGWDIPGREGGRPACWAPGTKIMMADASLKNVEDIVVGDYVMGPNFTPRRVLECHNGVDDMYEIIPTSGGMDRQIVNSNHLIPVEHRTRSKYNNHTKELWTAPELLKEFEKSESFRHSIRMYRAGGVDFKEAPVELDPYILGTWIGDGSLNRPILSNKDFEIIEAWSDWATAHGCNISIRPHSHKNLFTVQPTYISYKKRTGFDLPKKKRLYAGYEQRDEQGYLNPLLKALNKIGVLNYKDIPDEYIYNSRKVRLELLAGLIDTDGYYDKANKHFTFVQCSAREHISQKVAFIARSLGFKTSLRYNKYKNGERFVTVLITGNIEEIPTKVEKKKASGTKYTRFTNNNLYSSNIKINYLGKGEYYGFGVDGDHHLLLGDFTVTHNSFNQISAQDLTMTNVIAEYIQLMDKIEDMIGELSGVSKARQGQIHQSELVGNVERKIIQSSHITEVLFEVHNDIKRRVYTYLVDISKYAWKNSDKKSIYYILDDMSRNFINISEDFLYSDFDVFIGDSSKEMQNIETLKGLIQHGLQNGATLLDAANILTAENMNEIKLRLEDLEVKREKAQAEEQQMQQQIEEEKINTTREILEVETSLKQEELRIKEEDSIRKAETAIVIAQIKQDEGVEVAEPVTNDLEARKVELQEKKISLDNSLKRLQLAEEIRSNKKNEELKEKDIRVKRIARNKTNKSK